MEEVTKMKRVLPVVAVLLCSLSAFAQPTDAIQNWSAPPFWMPAKVETDAVAHSGRQALALPSSPMPFVAINPCRVLDTRNATGSYGGPIFAGGETRTYALASANPCTATLPTGIGAFSLNITVTSTAGAGFVEAYPSGVTRPLASNVNFLTAGAQVGNAAIVPTDGTANNDIDIYASQGTHIIVDMNGYYAPGTSNSSVPAGTILPFGGATAPAGFLMCDGSLVSRTTYAALFSAILINFGAGDAVSTFNLPDLQGRFLRGVTKDATRDPDFASRIAMAPFGNTGGNVGSLQNDDFMSHAHGGAMSITASPQANAYNPSAGLYFIWNGSTAAAGGNETRPKNAYVNFIIKY
jgi:microcystin-dependent protein